MKDQCVSASNYVSNDTSPSSSASEGTTSSARKEIRGLRLFKIISQRLGHLRRRQENKENNHDGDVEEEDDAEDGFSSNSSCDSAGGNTSLESPVHSDRMILRRSMDGRSNSTSLIATIRSLGDKRSSVPEPLTQQRKATRSILRAPVSYTYKKGLSGLPTQRVPICKGRCNCRMQHDVFRSYGDLHQYRYSSTIEDFLNTSEM